jgi:hypothetical protein
VMGWRIIKQPTGRFARWSDVVDDFTDYDMTEQEAHGTCVRLAGEAVADVKMRWAKISPGRFNEAIETIREVHGEELANQRREELSKESTT